jgi:large subunit GTPase 1
VVVITGYHPNVGKSSTINTLFGSKMTAVAPTPGNIKRFQVRSLMACMLLARSWSRSCTDLTMHLCCTADLNVTDDMCLCNCPGLVLPQYAHSKAEMVATGARLAARISSCTAVQSAF